MSAGTMASDSKITQNGDMGLSVFGTGVTDYDYAAAIERGQRPWRDRGVLAYLRIEKGMSFRQIAQEAFEGEISSEGVRQAAIRNGIEDERKSNPENLSPRELALRYSEEDDSEMPEGDDSHKKYTLRGSDR
ncbi:hypothetical protein [Halorubrum sp. CSM-61]|uniref:hypothetical protein n=1 Tax=Halorubrum sp. CSM-61 TaxID=2485838 RepID=UPI000F4BC86E|nr:hypothetical protein [Halorubrum sp. CSM-61]